MLRIRSSALVNDDKGRLVDGNTLFSGLAYDVDEHGVLQRIHVVDQGILTGLSNDWIDVPEGGERVDRLALETTDTYGPLQWRGAPFTGVVYYFDLGRECVHEEAFRNGYSTDDAQRVWYPSGAPKLVVSGEEGIAYFQNGALQVRRVGAKVLFNLVVDDDGHLRGIVLNDASLLDITTIQRMTFADELMLIGSAIDTSLLTLLRDNTQLAKVPHLWLVTTNVGSEGIDVLVSLGAMTKLTLSRNSALSEQHAELVRARRPDCNVEYEADVLDA